MGIGQISQKQDHWVSDLQKLICGPKQTNNEHKKDSALLPPCPNNENLWV